MENHNLRKTHFYEDNYSIYADPNGKQFVEFEIGKVVALYLYRNNKQRYEKNNTIYNAFNDILS